MMVKVLFPEEETLLHGIISAQLESGNLLQGALAKSIVHLPEKLISEKYDRGTVEEFLRELIKQSTKIGVEQYYQRVTEDETAHTLKQKCLSNGALEHNIFKSLGSTGLTSLIRDVLVKMREKKFGKQEITNLVHLVETRNKIRQAEEKFLEDAFRRYLDKQISLYS